jgi:hypothetical protein
MSMYSYCMFMYLHRVSWHSPATLTEVFPCFFLSRKANSRVKTRKDGARPALFQIFVFFYVLFVLCCSMYCLCVNVYCTTATGWLPNCNLQIYQYHIIFTGTTYPHAFTGTTYSQAFTGTTYAQAFTGTTYSKAFTGTI